MRLAEALLRRKELQDKVAQLQSINQRDLYEVRGERKKITDNVDDIIVQVPYLKLSQITVGYDHYAKRLRLIDAAIQQANWTTEIEVDSCVMEDFSEVEPEAPERKK